MSAEAAADWHRPPVEGYQWDDLDRIPDLPPHTELIDGSLVLVSPQKRFHMKCLRLLESALVEMAPPELFRVSREMTVVLGPPNRLEPDLLIVHAADEIDDDETWYPVEAVVLAVEVVSPDSRERDRVRKPLLYAGAGIDYFWLVERDEAGPVLRAFELDPATRQYAASGVFRERVRLSAPFAIDIDLSVIDRM